MLKCVELSHFLDAHRVETAHRQAKSASTPFFGAIRAAVVGQPSQKGLSYTDRFIIEARMIVFVFVAADALAISAREQLSACVDVLALFRDGICMLDEVDLLLHPLKSELNWPLGLRAPLDLSLPHGWRWLLPAHLLDGVLQATHGRSTTKDWSQHRAASDALHRLTTTLRDGVARGALLDTPHLVLLSSTFYTEQLMPALARWCLVWLADKGFGAVADTTLLELLTSVDAPQQLPPGSPNDDAHIKLFNLARLYL
jgi:hypothetical protein